MTVSPNLYLLLIKGFIDVIVIYVRDVALMSLLINIGSKPLIYHQKSNIPQEIQLGRSSFIRDMLDGRDKGI